IMDIDKLNQEIDGIDEQLLKLFEQRMELSQKIGQSKEELSLPAMDTEHERKILYKLCEKAKPELSGYVKVLFSSLFEISKSHQRTLKHYDSSVKKLLDDAVAQKLETFPLRAT
ncbi:chorismate mutase, partial [Treponema sp. R6D11]